MKQKNPAAVELGRKGGETTKNKLGPEHFKKLNKLSHEAKKRKKKLLVDERS